MVLFPVKASANLNELYVATAKNRLYAEQGRGIANSYAEKVKELYKKDSRFNRGISQYRRWKMEPYDVAKSYWLYLLATTRRTGDARG